MNYLQHISNNLLKVGQTNSPALRKLEHFMDRFVNEEYKEGHLLLACHAAFPVVVTSDLLYQLWLNFQNYKDENGDDQKIHRIAVSDLLQSSLLREIGTGVFEMNESLRTALLDCLETRFKTESPERINNLAQFLMQYYKSIPKGQNYIWDQVRDLQEWHAIAYLKPDMAAHKLREAMSDAVRADQKGQQFRLQMLVEKLDQQFEKLDKEERNNDTFQTLVAYSKGMKAYQEGEYKEAAQSFSNLPTTFIEDDKDTSDDVFTITVPKPVQEQLQEKEKEKRKGKIYAQFVAIDDYENIPKLDSTVSDAKKIQNWVESYASANQIELQTQSLFDQEADFSNVLTMVMNTIQAAGPEDLVFFYFAGTGTELPIESSKEPRAAFACQDFNMEDGRPQNGLLDVEFQGIIKNNSTTPFITLIFDACNVGVSSWIDVFNPKIAMLASSRVTQKSFETKEGGIFTSGLIRALEGSKGEISYLRIREQIDAFVTDDYQQTTQVFGAELAVSRRFLSNKTSNSMRVAELLLNINEKVGLVEQSTDDFLKEYGEEDTKNVLSLMKQVSTYFHQNELKVLNISGNQQADLFQEIEQEFISPALKYKHHNLEGDVGPNIQQQSNISFQRNIEDITSDPFASDSNLAEDVISSQMIFLAVNPWLIRQMRLDPSIGEALEEAMMRSIPIFPILVQNCDWESTIIRRIGIIPDGRIVNRKNNNFIPLYEEKLKSTLAIWQKAKINNIKSLIQTGKLEDALKELNVAVANNTSKHNELLQLETRYQSLRDDIIKGIIPDQEYQVGINKFMTSILSFIKELDVEDAFDIQIAFEAEEGAYAESEPPEQEATATDQRFLWCLDNGHGSLTAGKRSPVFDDGETQFFEYEFNRDIVARIKPQLEERGIQYFEVVPEVEVDNIIRERVERVNTYESDLPKVLVSVHCNAGPAMGNDEWTNDKIKGIETWHAHNNKDGKKIAQVFQRHLLKETGFTNRNLKSKPSNEFYILRNAQMPAILTENGFYNNKEEVLELMKDEVRQKIADAHVKAILDIEQNWDNLQNSGGTRTITGTVSSNDEPLIGANVLLEGTSTGSITDLDGRYSINVPSQGAVLVFSYTGFTEKRVEIEETNVADVVLEEEKSEAYEADWFNSKPYEVGLFSVSDKERREMLQALVRENSYALFDLSESSQSQEFEIGYEGVFVFREEGTEIFAGETRSNLEEEATFFLDKVQHYLQWRYVQTVETSSAVISPEDYEIQFFEGTNDTTAESVEELDFHEKGWLEDIEIEVREGQNAVFQMKITNISRKTLHVNALALMPDFSINNNLLPLAIIEPGQEVWLNEQIEGQLYRSIIIDSKQWLTNTQPSFKAHLKIFISQEPYDTTSLNQSALFNSQSEALWRNLPYMLSAEDLAGELISVEVKRAEDIIVEEDNQQTALQQKAEELLLEGKNKEVIELLLDRIDHKQEVYTEILVLGNWENLLRNYVMTGRVTSDTHMSEENRIQSSLRSIIKGLDELVITEESQNRQKQNSFVQGIQLAITEDRLEEALQDLIDNQAPNLEEILGLQSQLEEIEKESRTGRSSFEDLRLGRTRVAFQLAQWTQENENLTINRDIKPPPLHSSLKYFCDRQEEVDRFHQYNSRMLKEENNKLGICYIIANELHAPSDLVKRFAYEMEGVSFESATKDNLELRVEQRELNLRASKNSDILRTEFKRQLSQSLNIKAEILESINYTEFFTQSPIVENVDIFFLSIIISGYDYDPESLSIINNEIQSLESINKDDRIPQVVVSVVIECDEEDEDQITKEAPQIIQEQMGERALIILGLSMISNRDIQQWFRRFKGLFSSSKERQEIINQHFPEQEDMYMEDVVIQLGRFIDNWNSNLF